MVHAPVTRLDPDWKMICKALIRYPQRLLNRSYRPDCWFAVDPGVEVRWVPTLSARFVPDSDVVIATAWKTAEWVAAYPDEKGKKFYFIQGHENWDASAERVDATWTLPMTKIVVARWLQRMALDIGESSVYVPNAINQDSFHPEIAPNKREPCSVTMLYNTQPGKGTKDGLRAIEALKKVKPELLVALFGVPKRPDDLPGWIEYHSNPAQDELRRLYNKAALFLAPSHSEGWGLTALEAMACGSAVVATNNTGHLEFAVEGENALLVKAGDWEGMVKALHKLIVDEGLRLSLAESAVKTAERFSWESSTEWFEEALFNYGVKDVNEAIIESKTDA
jgi:glycosyltransferase involved in cell wall biosynthesis